jgi:uncharacterized protein (DUF1778 family)
MRGSGDSSFDGQTTRWQLDSRSMAAADQTSTDFFSSPVTPCAQEALADSHRIVLNQDEAVRFLDALETVDQDTIERLRVRCDRA